MGHWQDGNYIEEGTLIRQIEKLQERVAELEEQIAKTDKHSAQVDEYIKNLEKDNERLNDVYNAARCLESAADKSPSLSWDFHPEELYEELRDAIKKQEEEE